VKQYNVNAPDELCSINFNPAPIALVVNTDDSRNPGRHWVAVYIWKVHGKLYSDHYDSYGNYLSRYGIQLFQFQCINTIKKFISSIQLAYVVYILLGSYTSVVEELHWQHMLATVYQIQLKMTT
jgi:hypothetical protein